MSAEQVQHGSARGAHPAHDGLAEHIAAVEAARGRLGDDLAHVEQDIRRQMGHTVERILWKVAAAGAALAAGVAVRKALTAGWRAARKTDPPTNPASRSTGWADALAWTAATSVAVAVAKLVAERGAAAGWERATGTPPPGVDA